MAVVQPTAAAVDRMRNGWIELTGCADGSCQHPVQPWTSGLAVAAAPVPALDPELPAPPGTSCSLDPCRHRSVILLALPRGRAAMVLFNNGECSVQRPRVCPSSQNQETWAPRLQPALPAHCWLVACRQLKAHCRLGFQEARAVGAARRA